MKPISKSTEPVRIYKMNTYFESTRTPLKFIHPLFIRPLLLCSLVTVPFTEKLVASSAMQNTTRVTSQQVKPSPGMQLITSSQNTAHVVKKVTAGTPPLEKSQSQSQISSLIKTSVYEYSPGNITTEGVDYAVTETLNDDGSITYTSQVFASPSVATSMTVSAVTPSTSNTQEVRKVTTSTGEEYFISYFEAPNNTKASVSLSPDQSKIIFTTTEEVTREGITISSSFTAGRSSSVHIKSSESGDDKKWKIGLGIGVPLLLLGVGAGLWKRNQRSGNQNISPKGGEDTSMLSLDPGELERRLIDDLTEKTTPGTGLNVDPDNLDFSIQQLLPATTEAETETGTESPTKDTVKQSEALQPALRAPIFE